MAYDINLTNGQNLVSIADGTADTSFTSLTLFGKDYAGYGPLLDENFVKLLENFANSLPPPNALQGQLWWDSTHSTLNVRKETEWKVVSGPTSSALAPTSSIVGDLWWDSSKHQLYAYDGAQWIAIGPAYTTQQGLSGTVVTTVIDTQAITHTVTLLYVGGQVVSVISVDPTFTTNDLAGFAVIKPGFSLPLSSGFAYNGDAENSLSLGGVSAANFLRSDVVSTTYNSFKVQTNAGLTVGLNDDLTVNVANNAVNIIGNTTGRDLDFQTSIAGIPTLGLRISGTSGLVTVANDPATALGVATKRYVDNQITAAGTNWIKQDGSTPLTGSLAPITTNMYSLGSNNNWFSDVYATTYHGVNVLCDNATFKDVHLTEYPTVGNNAATKQYVDDSIYTFSGNFDLLKQEIYAHVIGNAPANLSNIAALSSSIGNSATFATDMSAQLALKAPIASPSFTGSPLAPTVTAGDVSNKIATTSFVRTAITGFAPIANPVFTGSPTAPTPDLADSSTKIATTAFVKQANLTNVFDMKMADAWWVGPPTDISMGASHWDGNSTTFYNSFVDIRQPTYREHPFYNTSGYYGYYPYCSTLCTNIVYEFEPRVPARVILYTSNYMQLSNNYSITDGYYVRMQQQQPNGTWLDLTHADDNNWQYVTTATVPAPNNFRGYASVSAGRTYGAYAECKREYTMIWPADRQVYSYHQDGSRANMEHVSFSPFPPGFKYRMIVQGYCLADSPYASQITILTRCTFTLKGD